MKKLLFLFVAFFTITCNNLNGQTKNLDLEKKILTEGIVGHEIGKINDGKAVLTISKDIVNQGMHNLIIIPADSERKNYHPNFNNSIIEKIEDTYYLRSKSDEGQITTTLLKLENNKLFVEGISCTSSSNEGGCIPEKNGLRCTSCDNLESICTKTISK
ncbi:hypothetical protein [Ornithobacterium rhinotracheale]|uniref:hypothetical protein n=1 Tax=Ornithobacterium rhinotracheale TaxID=28251 RepID=UPI0040360CBA